MIDAVRSELALSFVDLTCYQERHASVRARFGVHG